METTLPAAFDIRRIVHGHRLQSENGLTRHRLSTHRRWYKRHLLGDLTFINMFLNTDGGNRPERRLTIDVCKKKLLARMDRFPSGKRVGYTKVLRPNKWSVSVAFPESLIGQDITSYNGTQNAFFHTGGDGPCGTPTDVVRTCVDRAPNRGHVKYRL